MHSKHLPLVAATVLALSSLGCRSEVTAPANRDRPSLSLAATTSTENVERVIAVTKFVPCANGGLGEDVSLSGSFHDKFHVTLDGHGGAHVEVLHNPQGVSGVGLTTGTKYVGAGASPQDESNVTVGEEHTSVTNMRILGQGPNNNLLIHTDFHVTILANGTVTSFHDNVSIVCH
jgi:hypothetical protein